MEYSIAFMPGEQQTATRWAQRREEEGWAGLGVADHIAPQGLPYGHLLITLAELAAATSTVKIASCHANSLLRSPIDFAHAAMSLQAMSGGRFEAGLGAGWTQVEVEAMGIDFPDGPERARRFREAAVIVRDVLHTGASHFEGDFYQSALDKVGVDVTPPLLTVAVGGPWTCREVAPLGDRVEIAPFAAPLRSGHMNLKAWHQGTPDVVKDLAQRARAANPDAPPASGASWQPARTEESPRSVRSSATAPAQDSPGAPKK
jgi:alkanesulfonate monooxygenase SsuD/methylene tetrahydromethanopterin reductase-like flavin-dependent oxidoreductase (luciferase family)